MPCKTGVIRNTVDMKKTPRTRPGGTGTKKAK